MVYQVYQIFMVRSRKKVYPVYRVMIMKRTEYITYRTDQITKSALATIAAEKKWSISQLSEEIIKEWLQEKRPDLLPEET